MPPFPALVTRKRTDSFESILRHPGRGACQTRETWATWKSLVRLDAAKTPLDFMEDIKLMLRERESLDGLIVYNIISSSASWLTHLAVMYQRAAYVIPKAYVRLSWSRLLAGVQRVLGFLECLDLLLARRRALRGRHTGRLAHGLDRSEGLDRRVHQVHLSALG